jgi:hypothetical protein
MFMLPVDIIRENAKKLYNVLSKTWCSTHSSHSAGLLLEQRLVKKPKRGGPGWQRKRLTLDHCDTNYFSLSLLQPSISTSKKWLDVEIRLVESSASGQQSGYIGRRRGRIANVERDQGSDLGIEERSPPKAAALTAKFGGKFPCNLRWTVETSPV